MSVGLDMPIEVAALILLSAVLTASPVCRKSEFACNNGRCVPYTHFCDAANDCGDSSDEPRFCTPCNRTYFGDVGRSYELELHRPKEDKIPYVCNIILTAGGGSLGDLVQVTFDSFTLGKFTSFTQNGCPDGHIQITEADRPQMGGQWCGTSWGPTIYYSETRSVVITVRLLRLSKDQSGYNFDFRIGFKMLTQGAAVVRYGGATPGPYNPDRDANITTLYTLPAPTPSPMQYLGDLITSTYCSRIFSDCSERTCTLLSPNFPGIYPRNLTCFYAVRQHQVPAGKHALISVSQRKGQMIAIRSSGALYPRANQQQAPKTHRQLKLWSECDEVQDYVTIYDGYTTRDPVLIKFCGGGEPMPTTISSGPEILVEFTTSPYGTFLHPGPAHSFHGFQLDVQVQFLDKDSTGFTRNKKCEFMLRGSDKGVLESPYHALPFNTTCIYHLEGMNPLRVAPTFRPAPGRFPAQYDPNYHLKHYTPPPPQYRVWLSVLKFHVSPHVSLTAEPTPEPCATNLQVWDGSALEQPCNDVFCEKERARPGAVPAKPANLSLLARYCKDHVPRSCDHGLLGNQTRYPRPCTLTESFLSSGNAMTLQLKMQDPTALRPVSFKALYEFVDLHQDGMPFGRGPCSRKFISRSGGPIPNFPQKFESPKDVFLFGRGGQTNLSCVYRFEGFKGEKLKLSIQQLETGGRKCESIWHEDIGRACCHGNATTALRILEFPLSDNPPITRHCLCSGKNLVPFSFTSSGHMVELRFDLLFMNASDDYRNLHFVGSWEFIRHTVCQRQQGLSASSGQIVFTSPSKTPEEINCEYQPWVIEPSKGKYLYVAAQGIALNPERLSYQDIMSNISIAEKQPFCASRNRIIIHAGPQVTHVVCPYLVPTADHQVVEVFSEGWQPPPSNGGHPEIAWYLLDEVKGKSTKSRSIVVEFLGREQASYAVTWLELYRRKPVLPPEGFVMKDCLHRCPELDACINSSLWCDGVSHCPSGFDESIRHCYEIFQLPALYLAFGLIGIICICCALCIALVRACKKKRRQARLKNPPSDGSLFGEKEVIS